MGTKPYWVSNLVPESVLLGTRLEGQDEEPQASAVASGVFIVFFSNTNHTNLPNLYAIRIIRAIRVRLKSILKFSNS